MPTKDDDLRETNLLKWLLAFVVPRPPEIEGDYQTINPNHVVVTLDRLHDRIIQRFPNSGLSKVCDELRRNGYAISTRAAQLAAPNWRLRTAIGVLIVVGFLSQVVAFNYFHFTNHLNSLESGFIENVDAAVNLTLLFGGAIWFLLTLEERIKRDVALTVLHRLRSVAHVIDMHQLTKDPVSIIQEREPIKLLTKFQLTRYLDYCAEMLAIIGKLAALYADNNEDKVVITTVNEIETLTTNLANKIWQKIMTIGALEDAPPPTEDKT